MGFDFLTFLARSIHGLVSCMDDMAARFDFSCLDWTVWDHLLRSSCSHQTVFFDGGWAYSTTRMASSVDRPSGRIVTRDYHYLSQFEIAGGKRISQHLSGMERLAPSERVVLYSPM
jgi:hypothetical protein